MDLSAIALRRFGAGDVVFQEGDPGDFAYLIEEGEVEISTSIDGEPSVLCVHGPGSVFGELALIDDQSRAATAVALGNTLLTAITREQVAQRLESADPILQLVFGTVMWHFRSELSRSRSTQKTSFPASGDQAIAPRLDNAVELIRMESELRTAIAEGQFSLAFQPVVNMADGMMQGVEALIRWYHPQRGVLMPNEFITVTESTSLILPIGKWALEEGLIAQKALEQAAGRPITLSINIAARQMEDPSFVGMLINAVDRAGVSRNRVTLEILEHSLLSSDVIVECLRRCRGAGFQLALDDFGTGYSCLQYLTKYKIDTLKIDRTFIKDLDTDLQSLDICRIIVNLAKALGIKVVAEGVETHSQAKLLREMGCASAQGYLYACPMPLAETLGLLKSPVELQPARV